MHSQNKLYFMYVWFYLYIHAHMFIHIDCWIWCADTQDSSTFVCKFDLYVFFFCIVLYEFGCQVYTSELVDHCCLWASFAASYRVAVKMLVGAAVMWRLEWDWRVYSHGWQIGAGCWQEASVLYMGLRVARVFSWYRFWLPPED